MYPDSWLSRLASADRPAAEDLHALLKRAQSLRDGSATQAQPLLGKRLGLMSPDPQGEDGQLFEQAARGLGAHVAVITTPAEQIDGDSQRLTDMGRLLGRLYDTVECQGLSGETVDRLAQAGNLPMHNGLAGREHWIFRMAEEWQAEAPLRDRRRWLIQAFLITTLS
jgi:ornithine carbamoyltransferase